MRTVYVTLSPCGRYFGTVISLVISGRADTLDNFISQMYLKKNNQTKQFA